LTSDNDLANVGEFFNDNRWQRKEIKSWLSSKSWFSYKYNLHKELSSCI